MAAPLQIESMLSGGHPNSLGRTDEVVELVLCDRSRLDELYGDDWIVQAQTIETLGPGRAKTRRWPSGFCRGSGNEPGIVGSLSRRRRSGP